MSAKSLYIPTLVLGSLLAAADGALAFSSGEMPSGFFVDLWPFAFAILIALWVAEDSKIRPGIYRPHEFGFLVLIYWAAYTPYYLVRTRGLVGVFSAVGLIVLYYAGALSFFIAAAL